MTPQAHPSLYTAPSLAHALAALAERGTEGAPFAGGTWIMRAPLRHERTRSAYVALGRVPELGRIEIGDDHVAVGAGVTHARLAAGLAGLPDLRALAEAAGRSANPAIRQVATIGGNLSTPDFAAADLIPALLCLGTEVEIASSTSVERLSLEDFLALRSDLLAGCLLTRIVVPRSLVRSAHARLPLRKAGDYPVAILSIAVTRDRDGRVDTARVAVGAVEPVARRWSALEEALAGAALDATTAERAAADLSGVFIGREGVEAPGWYRVAVLPALVRRAVTALL